MRCTMSRSYRKHPILKAKSHFSQKMAARILRRNNDYLSDGAFYKRCYSQWEIIDYSCYTPFKEYLDLKSGSWELWIHFNHPEKSEGLISYKYSTEKEKKLYFSKWKKEYLRK